MIYIDISNLLENDFLTGIQRVVREVVVRMLQDSSLNVVLFSWSVLDDKFDIISNNDFLDFFKNGKGAKNAIRKIKKESIDEISPGAIFFDIDAVWNSTHKRNYVYPRLKNNGIKIAVYVYDIIPIFSPQYTDSNTLFNFLSYILATLRYADIVFVSTKTTKKRLETLSNQLNLPSVYSCVTWLGADFSVKDDIDKEVSKEVIDVVKKGKYILVVGTIEPRKNHKLLLDAYDAKLSALGINIVFAGRIGWKVDDLINRIYTHPEKDKGVFLLEKQNNASIKFLYQNAFIVAFPTFDEGFGLPLVESLQNGVVTIASNVEVIREVGGNFCEYFDPNDVNEFCTLVENYINNEEKYRQQKAKIKQFKPMTWDFVTKSIVNELKSFNNLNKYEVPTPKQIFFLTARSKNLLNTLPYYELFMSFIKEAVILCPERIVKEIKEQYCGSLKLSFLTDENLLAGEPLPSDHITRNVYLRCLAMKSEQLDDVFIMSDDDYRPLKKICLSDFISDGKYIGYYCGNLNFWTGSLNNKNSFDFGMKRAYSFLQEKNYPFKMYAAHMPQIIDKNIYNEMINLHPEMTKMGLCEWSVYFNYGMSQHSDIFTAKVYRTMCWPNHCSDWNREYVQPNFLFENFYEENYNKGGIFQNFSKLFSDNLEEENVQKEAIIKKQDENFFATKNYYNNFYKNYIAKYREEPSFGLLFLQNEKKLFAPKYLTLRPKTTIFIRFNIKIDKNILKTNNIRICFYIYNKDGIPKRGGLGPTYIQTSETFQFLPINVFDVSSGDKIIFSTWIGEEVLQTSIPILVPKQISFKKKLIRKCKKICPSFLKRIIKRILKG